jgi:hypothetical protein
MIALFVHGSPACAQRAELSIASTGQGQVNFDAALIGGLSGITYLGGDSYLVVSDSNGTMAPATITIDRATGQILDASLGTPVSVAGAGDLEAVAYDPRDGSVLISSEAGNTITRHAASNGGQIGSITLPGIYTNARGNRGLESLSLDPRTFNLWTANEEALTVDGGLSTDSQGTVVRIQRFDPAGQPDAQVGYLTQPHSGDGILVQVPGQSGVSDLVALPDGRVIVLERELGGLPTYRNRLYAIDPQSATDTSGTPALTPNSQALIDKALLYQVEAAFTNFEGAALGPMLADGDYALLLVSDDGASGNPQRLLSLRLSGLAVEGDLTGDFVVDQDDLAVVLNHWGASVPAGDRLVGDPSGDGGVGVEDLDTVLAHWTLTNHTTPAANVPEPGVFTLSAGTLWALSRRW